jgi:hypothetical protein
LYARFLGALFTLPVTIYVNRTFNIVLANFINLTGLFPILQNNIILTNIKNGYLLSIPFTTMMKFYTSYNNPMSVDSEILSTLFGIILRLNILRYTPKMVVATIEKLLNFKLTKDAKVVVKEIVQKEK